MMQRFTIVAGIISKTQNPTAVKTATTHTMVESSFADCYFNTAPHRHIHAYLMRNNAVGHGWETWGKKFESGNSGCFCIISTLLQSHSDKFK